MLKKQVQVVKVNTMADGTIRLTVDLLNGNGADMAEAYGMMEQDTTLVLMSAEEVAFAENEEAH